METTDLKYFQIDAIRQIVPLIHQKERILLSMPIGTGKTITGVNIVYEYYKVKGGIGNEKVLFLVDRAVMAEETKKMLSMYFDDVQVLKSFDNIQVPISICTINSLAFTTELIKIPSNYYDIIVLLGCDHFPFNSASFLDILHHFDASCKIGLTSSIKKSILSYFSTVSFKYTLEAAINDGVLNNYKIIDPGYSVEANAQLSSEQLNALGTSIIKFTNNKKTVVFCNSINNAIKISEELNKITGQENYAISVTSNGKTENVNGIISEFRNSDYPKVLTSVELLASGISLPNTKYVVLLKNVSSEDIFLHLISNFLSPFLEEEYLTVIDYTGKVDNIVPKSLVRIEQNSDTDEESDIFVRSQAKIFFRDNSLNGVIGVHDIAEELANLIDLMPNESGRMIGLFGEWGRGKTFLMKHTWDNLKKKNSFYKVDFQAWKYQETPAIWAYLYEKIAESYYNSTTNILGKLVRRFKLNFYRLGWHNLVVFLIYFGFSLFTLFGLSYVSNLRLAQILYTSLGSAAMLSILTLILRFKNSARELFNKYYSKASFTHVLGIQAEVQKELKNLIKAWVGLKDCKINKLATNRKILLFVDDIDRCSEDKIIQLIDSLRIMLDDEELSKKLVVVAAIDERILKRAIKLKYIYYTRDGLEGLSLDSLVTEYMDKLFIIGIKLGSLTADEKDEFFLELTKEDRDSFIPTSFTDLIKEDGSDEYDSDILMEEDNKLDEETEYNLDASINHGEIGRNREEATSHENNLGNDMETTLKLTSYEINILRRKLQLYPKVTPRQIRVFYYRYLIAKQLLIKQYNKVNGENIWVKPLYIDIFIELLIKLTQYDSSQSVSDLKKKILQSNEKDFLFEGITDKKSISRIHCKRLICVLDTVIGY